MAVQRSKHISKNQVRNIWFFFALVQGICKLWGFCASHNLPFYRRPNIQWTIGYPMSRAEESCVGKAAKSVIRCPLAGLEMWT